MNMAWTPQDSENPKREIRNPKPEANLARKLLWGLEFTSGFEFRISRLQTGLGEKPLPGQSEAL
jgi:hypothetical protein